MEKDPQELIEILQSISMVAKRLAEKLMKLEEKVKEQEPSMKQTTKEDRISIEEIRAVLAAKAQNGRREEVKALIIKYGGKKLTDIDPAFYPELVKEANEL